jgi:hypothetical protein
MYKSEVIRVTRNSSKDIELPFQANYIRIDLVQQDRGLISISLDGGDDIPILHSFITLDYKFTKFTIKYVTSGTQYEDVELLYFVND